MDEVDEVDGDERNKWEIAYGEAHDVRVENPSSTISSPSPALDYDHHDEIETLIADGSIDDPEVMEKKVKEMRKLRSQLLKYAAQLNRIRSSSKKREICLKNMTQRVIVEQDKMNTSLINLDRLSKKVSEAKLKVSQDLASLDQLDLDTKDKIQKLAQKEREYLVETEKLDSLEKIMKNRKEDLDKEIEELERVSGLIFKIDLDSFSLLDFQHKLSKFQKEVEQKFIFLKEIEGHIDSEIEAKLKENLSKDQVKSETTVDQNINQTVGSRPGTSTRDKTSFLDDINQIISKFSESGEQDPIQVNLHENFAIEIPLMNQILESNLIPESYAEDQNQDFQKVDPLSCDVKCIDELMSDLLKIVEETPSPATIDEVSEKPAGDAIFKNYSDEDNESLKLEISSGSSEESSADEDNDGEEKVENKHSILEILKGPFDECESSECLETWDKIMSREGRVKIIPELNTNTNMDRNQQNEIEEEESQNIVKIFESNVNQKASQADIMAKCNSEDMVVLSKDLENSFGKKEKNENAFPFNPFLLKLVNYDQSGSEDLSSNPPPKYSRKTPPKDQQIKVVQKESSFHFRESEIKLIEDQNDMQMTDFKQVQKTETLVLPNQIKIKWSNSNCEANFKDDTFESKIEPEKNSKPSAPPRPRQVVFDLEPILANSNSTSGLFNPAIAISNIPSDFQDDGSSTSQSQSQSKGPRILRTRPPIPKVVKPISKMLQNQMKYEKKSSRAHSKSTKSHTSTHTHTKSIYSIGFHSTGSLPAAKVPSKKSQPGSSTIPKYTASSKLFTSTSTRSSMIYPSNSSKATSKDKKNHSHMPDHLKFGIFQIQNPSASSTSNSNDLKKR